MGTEQYGPDALFAPDEILRQGICRFGSPLLVYGEDALRQKASEIQQAFGGREFFPIKACCNPAVLRVLLDAGCGLVCGSMVELRLAFLAGAKGEDLLFSSAFPSEAELRFASSSGAVIIADSLEQIDLLKKLACVPKKLALRLNPGVKFSLPGQIPGRWSSDLGLYESQLLAAARMAMDYGVERIGLQINIGFNVTHNSYFAAKASALSAAAELMAESGIPISWLDLGGGLALQDGNGHPMDLKIQAEGTKQCLLGRHMEHLPIRVELGRYLTGPCGVLLSTVRGIKVMEKTVVGLDVSMADLPKAVYSGTHYHVSKLGDSLVHNRQSYYLAGWSTDFMDHFGGRRILPPLRPGDVLAFHNAGAYTRSMASNYGGSLRCAEAMVTSSGDIELIAPRETAP